MPWGWSKESGESDEWSGFLESAVLLEGNLSAEGTLRVNCAVKGKLKSKHRLLIGALANVEGDLEAHVLVIEGRFRGLAHGFERVEVKTSASITGEVTSPCILIEPGAVFRGKCHVVRGAGRTETILVRPAPSVQK